MRAAVLHLLFWGLPMLVVAVWLQGVGREPDLRREADLRLAAVLRRGGSAH